MCEYSLLQSELVYALTYYVVFFEPHLLYVAFVEIHFTVLWLLAEWLIDAQPPEDVGMGHSHLHGPLQHAPTVFHQQLRALHLCVH